MMRLIDRARGRALYVGFVLALCGGAGCGESASSAPDAPGMRDASAPDSSTPDSTIPDGGMPEPDAPDLPPTDPEFLSNTRNAIVVDVGTPATPTIKLIRSNLLQERLVEQVFQQWLGEIRNDGATTICQVHAEVRFENASSEQLAVFEPHTSASPHIKPGGSRSIACIPPGQIGSLYDNGFVTSAVTLSEVTQIAVAFTFTSDSDAVPAPQAPLITSYVESGFRVEGTLTGREGAIHGILLEFYPLNARGLVVDWLIDLHLDTLEPGARVSFSSLSALSPFTEYRSYVQFGDGPSRTLDAALLDDPVAARELARRATQQANRERAALARAQ